MNIIEAQTQDEFEEITQFFGEMWKQEFGLDRFDRIDEYKNGTVFYIKEDDLIVSAIALYNSNEKMKIGRFGTLEDYRGEGYGTTLLNYTLKILKEQGEKEIILVSDVNKTTIYERFGFKALGESLYVGHIKGIEMKKVL